MKISAIKKFKWFPQGIYPETGEDTKKFRRILIIVSSLLLFIIITDPNVRKVNPLGITIEDLTTNSIINLLGLINLYFLIAFYLKHAHDMNRLSLHDLEREIEKRVDRIIQTGNTKPASQLKDEIISGKREEKDLSKEYRKITMHFDYTNKFQYAVDFYLPMALGWVSIGWTLTEIIF